MNRSKRLLAVLFAVIFFLPTSGAIADEGPARKEMTSPNQGKDSTDVNARVYRDKDPQQEHIEQETPRKRNMLARWLAMAERVQAEQPDWLSPLVTTSGRLKQEFRYDIWDQPSTGGNRAYEFGGNKGFEFITSPRTQLLVGIPTYNVVSPNGPPGGSGDLPLMLKFRIASAERTEGSYLLTFLLSATAPTGSHRFGSDVGVLTPTMAFGKGWKSFDVQSTVGISLPTGDTTKLGRQVLWNTAFQYRAAWKLWPELEANTTFYETGKYAGNVQLFLTPGLGFGRVCLAGRFRFSSALGMQIAATRFHTYDHRVILSTRLSF
jgi:hypothetical protein